MAPLLELLALITIFCLYKIYRASTARTEASAVRPKWDISVYSPDTTNGTLVVSIHLDDNAGSNTQTGGRINITWRPISPQDAHSSVETPSSPVRSVTTQDTSSLIQLATRADSLVNYDPGFSSSSQTRERKENHEDGQSGNPNDTELLKKASITLPQSLILRNRFQSQDPTASVKDDTSANPVKPSPSTENPPCTEPLESIAPSQGPRDPVPPRPAVLRNSGEVLIATANKTTSRDQAQWREIDVATPSVQCPYVSPLTARRCPYENNTGQPMRWVEAEWKHWRCHILDEIHAMSHKTLEIGHGTLITSKELFDKYLERDIVCDVCHKVLSDKCDLQARVDNLNPNRDHIRICNFCAMAREMMAWQLCNE